MYNISYIRYASTLNILNPEVRSEKIYNKRLLVPTTEDKEGTPVNDIITNKNKSCPHGVGRSIGRLVDWLVGCLVGFVVRVRVRVHG